MTHYMQYETVLSYKHGRRPTSGNKIAVGKIHNVYEYVMGTSKLFSLVFSIGIVFDRVNVISCVSPIVAVNNEFNLMLMMQSNV